MTGHQSWMRITIILSSFSLGCGVEPLRIGDCDDPTDRPCWTQLGLDGKWVTAVADTPWGLYAGTKFDGLYRFDSLASDWIALGLDHAIVATIAHTTAAGGRLLVGMRPYSVEPTDAAVFASADSGLSWAPSDGGLASQNFNRFWALALAVDPSQPARVFMGSSAQVLRSLDGGQSWEFVFGRPGTSAQGVWSVAISPLADGRLWAGGSSAFGAAFVLAFEDWGESSQIYFPNGNGEQFVYQLALEDPERLLLGMQGGVALSTDGGMTVQPVLRRAGTVMGLIVSDGIAYAVSRVFSDEAPEGGQPPETLGVYQSLDGGSNWNPVSAPNVRGGTALVEDRQGRLIVGTAGSGVWQLMPARD